MIIIITGPCGIGKTSVSETLYTRFDRAVMLDGDYIGAVHPFEIYDDARIDYLYRTLQNLVAFHIREGNYHHFVINYVFESPKSLMDLCLRLAVYDNDIFVFRLTASDAAIAERIVKREGADGADTAWYLHRYQELVAIQDKAAQCGDMGFAIDSTGLSAEQTANMILDKVSEGVARMSVSYNKS